MGKGLIVVVVLVVIVLALFGQYIGVRNHPVAKDQAVKAAWSQVDIVLQRRADLIPNLVETVKGYAQQEVTVFGDIAKARVERCFRRRRRPTRLPPTDSWTERWAACWRFRENYPQLKSNENFMRSRMNWRARKTGSLSSASAITTRYRITTPMSCSSRRACLRDLRDLSRTRHTSRHRKARARFQKSTSARSRAAPATAPAH